MDRVIRFGFAVALLSTSLVLAFSAPAEAVSGVTIDFSPSEITLVRGQSVTVALTIENASEKAITGLHVGEIDSAEISIDLDDDSSAIAAPEGATIPAGGSLVVTAVASIVGPLPSPTTVVADVAYALDGVERHDAASLKVTPASWPAAVAGPLTITAKGGTELVDTSGVDLIFGITNASGAEQTIDSAVFTYPDYLEVTVAGREVISDNGRLELTDLPPVQAGSGYSILARVTAPDGVRPGTALIALDVTYEQVESTAMGFATANQSLNLSVFGESTVSSVFTSALAPAFWVVPGVLFVLVIWFLWTKVHPKVAIDITTGSGVAATAGLGIVALFPALLFPAVYNWLFRRHFPDIYGFADVTKLIIFAAVAGFLTWLLLVLGRELIRHFRFESGDSAMTVLRKLRWRPRQLNIPTAKLTPATGTAREIMILRSGKDTALVAPLMRVSGYTAQLAAPLAANDARGVYRVVRANLPASVLSFVTASATVSEEKLSQLSEYGELQIISST